MKTLKKGQYKVLLNQVLSWAKECLSLIHFKKAWEKGKVPNRELAAKALEGQEKDQKLVEEIFHANIPGHSPSLDVQRESTEKLAEELDRPAPAWPQAEIQVFGEPNGKSRKKKKPVQEAEAIKDLENAHEDASLPAEEPAHSLQESTEATTEESLECLKVVSEPSPPVEKKIPPRTPSFPNRPTILVIDDYRPLRNMIQKALLGASYNVCTAEDGVEGIVRVHENEVDLVVCDVQMPRLDGFEMSKMLNVRDRTREIPVIFLTEVLDEPTKAVAKRLGAADTLIKPFTMDALFESIRMVLASHKVSDKEITQEEEVSEEKHLVAAQG